MSLIVAEGVNKSWSDKDVLRNVCLTLSPQEHVGLVGPNGEGKTTLLRILAGLEAPTEGNIQRKSGLRIGYLAQDPPALAGSSLRQAMMDVFARLQQVEVELHDLAHQMEQNSSNEQLLARYGELQHEFELRGGELDAQKIEQVLTGMGFPRELWDMPLAHLSGGQRTRAYLGRLLLEDPDVLFLDEPTNHLDLDAVEWLEKWLQGFAGALVVVSHDRYFLDRTTTRTWEVAFTAVECYTGNYTHYLTQREERFKERMRRWEAQQEYIRETEEFIRRFLAGQRSSEAKGRRTRLERFMKTEAIACPRKPARISVRLKTTERTGDFVLYLTNLQAGYEAQKPLVSIEKLDVQRGQRIAIVGPNGCGKTTLLQTVLGRLPALAGNVRLGANVRFGYVSQTHSELAAQMTAIQAVRQADTSISDQHARNLLGSLLLSDEDAFKQIGQLSGGQRSRVVLARLMRQKANVLVMDEPTNHLDIGSQEVLHDVLSDFDGTVIFVSHDRYLIQALATHIWALHDGAIKVIAGGWEKYVQFNERQLEAQAGGTGATAAAVRKEQNKETYERRREDEKQRRQATNTLRKAQRRVEELEALIHTLDGALKSLNHEISQASAVGDMERIAKLGTEYSAQDARMRELYAEWEKLAATMEKG